MIRKCHGRVNGPHILSCHSEALDALKGWRQIALHVVMAEAVQGYEEDGRVLSVVAGCCNKYEY